MWNLIIGISATVTLPAPNNSVACIIAVKSSFYALPIDLAFVSFYGISTFLKRTIEPLVLLLRTSMVLNDSLINNTATNDKWACLVSHIDNISNILPGDGMASLRLRGEHSTTRPVIM